MEWIHLTVCIQIRYCRLLEEGLFRGRAADLFFMLLIGASLMTLMVTTVVTFRKIKFLGQPLSFMMVLYCNLKHLFVDILSFVTYILSLCDLTSYAMYVTSHQLTLPLYTGVHLGSITRKCSCANGFSRFISLQCSLPPVGATVVFHVHREPYRNGSIGNCSGTCVLLFRVCVPTGSSCTWLEEAEAPSNTESSALVVRYTDGWAWCWCC